MVGLIVERLVAEWSCMPGVHGRASCSVGGLVVGIAEELLYISVWLVMMDHCVVVVHGEVVAITVHGG